MNQLLKGLVLLIVILMASPAIAAKEAPIKVGVIDIQKIMRESKAAKNAQAIYMKDREGKVAILTAKSKEIRSMEEELKNIDEKLSSQEKKEKGEKLAKEVKEFKRLDSDLAEELKKKDVELAQKIYAEIREIVKKFFKNEHYTVILEKNSVVISDDAVDITDKIIKLYDGQNR